MNLVKLLNVLCLQLVHKYKMICTYVLHCGYYFFKLTEANQGTQIFEQSSNIAYKQNSAIMFYVLFCVFLLFLVGLQYSVVASFLAQKMGNIHKGNLTIFALYSNILMRLNSLTADLWTFCLFSSRFWNVTICFPSQTNVFILFGFLCLFRIFYQVYRLCSLYFWEGDTKGDCRF